ncbi:hypothetical protein MKX01_036316 [Papaver californicum]|nr:hypothetical protein MKX01_036316 [Papaver californicum]
MKISQHSKYFCEFCVCREEMKAVGIWGCKNRGKVKDGGVYTLNAVTVRNTIQKLREQTDN